MRHQWQQHHNQQISIPICCSGFSSVNYHSFMSPFSYHLLTGSPRFHSYPFTSKLIFILILSHYFIFHFSLFPFFSLFLPSNPLTLHSYIIFKNSSIFILVLINLKNNHQNSRIAQKIQTNPDTHIFKQIFLNLYPQPQLNQKFQLKFQTHSSFLTNSFHPQPTNSKNQTQNFTSSRNHKNKPRNSYAKNIFLNLHPKPRTFEDLQPKLQTNSSFLITSFNQQTTNPEYQTHNSISLWISSSTFI